MKDTKPLLSIAVMYPETTSNEELAAFIANVPRHPDVQLVMCENRIKPHTNGVRLLMSKDKVIRLAHTMHEFVFDEARNVVKQHCEGEWILSLDFDEFLATPINAIVSVLRGLDEETEGVQCTVLSHVRELSDDTSYPYKRIASAATRLFRNRPSITWMSRCHEVVDFTIPPDNIADSSITILHYGYDAEADVLRSKYERNIELLAKEISQPRSKDTKEHAMRYMIISCADYHKNFTNLTL